MGSVERGASHQGHIAGQAKLHRMRNVVRMLVNMLPEAKRNTREVQEILNAGKIQAPRFER